MFIKSGNYKCYCTLQNCGSFNQFSNLPIVFVVVQSLRRVRLCATPGTAARQAPLSFVVSRSSNSRPLSRWCHPTISSCRPLLLPPSIFPSTKVFPDQSALRIRRPEYWSFSISPSNEYSGLTSFTIDWLDLLAVQGTLKSLPQNHSLKASTLWCSAFFTVQFSHPYVTTAETVALTRRMDE